MTEPVRCAALYYDGKQCKGKGTKVVKYLGKREIYSSCDVTSFPIDWVKIKICKDHYKEHFSK